MSDGMAWIWVLFLLIFLIPVLQQRLLARARKKLMARIEKESGSRVITLVHRQEALSFLGLPFFKYISIEDSEQILRAIRQTDSERPIDLILHTPGGLVLASLQISKALQRHPSRVRVLIPHYAMSGGSMLAIAADEILMDAAAVLGPIDPQIGGYPAASLVRLLYQKPRAKIGDQMLIYADISEKALVQIRFQLESLLKKSLPERAEELSRVLSEGRWTHDHPISFEEAKSLGLKVSSDLPDLVHDLLELYPQPSRRMGSVEYRRQRNKPQNPSKPSGNGESA
ncbi:MAG: hypothetical protein EA369_00930 [Bradymonadales bacterium]|nr:MAG: hypothetical protein EA369_00930 [Bradymonadales bacterium]